MLDLNNAGQLILGLGAAGAQFHIHGTNTNNATINTLIEDGNGSARDLLQIRNDGVAIFGNGVTTGQVGIRGTAGSNFGSTLSHSLTLGDDLAFKTTTTMWTNTSDIRLKTDTSGFLDGMNVIREIHPVNYKYKAS